MIIPVCSLAITARESYHQCHYDNISLILSHLMNSLGGYYHMDSNCDDIDGEKRGCFQSHNPQ